MDENRSSTVPGPQSPDPGPLLGVLGVLALVASVWNTAASDWPQFQGPDGSGVSPETGLLRTWPPEGPRAVWAVPLGEGFGGAAVRDGEVYILDRVGGSQDVLRCLDLATGREKWTFAYDAPGRFQYDGSRTTPTVDEKYVFTMGPLGHFHCVERASPAGSTAHQAVWAKNIIRDFPDHAVPSLDRANPDLTYRLSPNGVPKWGVSQHPVLYKDTVIVTPQSVTVGVAAYARDSGELRWKSPPVGLQFFCHSSPYLTRLGGVDQVVVLSNEHLRKTPRAVVSGVDANTGQLLWTTFTPRSLNIPMPSPVKIADDRLFITGGYRYGASVLRVSKPDGQRNVPPGWATEFLWDHPTNCTPHVQNVLFYQGHLYANSFDKFHNPIEDGVMLNHGLECLDLDGRILWKTGPKRFFDSGNLLIADGLLFVLNGLTGELTLAEARPEGFKELARAKVLKARSGYAWAPMALADGKLLVRDQDELKCLEVKRPSGL